MVDRGELFAHGAVVRLHQAAEMLHGTGDRDQLFLQRQHGGRLVHAAQLALDVVDAVGERDELFAQASGVERLQPLLHPLRTVVDIAHASFAGKAVHQGMQGFEFGLQPCGFRVRGRSGKLVDAVGEAGEIRPHVLGEIALFGLAADSAHFLAQHADFAGNPFGDVPLQVLPERHQRARNLRKRIDWTRGGGFAPRHLRSTDAGGG